MINCADKMATPLADENDGFPSFFFFL